MSKYREEILNKLEETEEKAKQMDCWRSIIFFESPIEKQLEYRVIYTEHQHDAQQWAYDMHVKYYKLKIPYTVFSTAYNANYDGGLLSID